jgi:uncharacterized protein YgbK (DUF1537 family)
MASEAELSKRWILAVADDLTGALETGAKFAGRGMRARVTTELSVRERPDVPVLVVDTETRHLSADAAFSVVREVVHAALRFEPWLIYKKTDSTLRGNIAPELRALLELIPCRSMVYAPAYPEMGRTVRRGRLFVAGEPVDQTVFADDPVDPVRESDLGVILRGLPVQVEDGETSDDVLAVAARIIAADPPPLAAGPAALAGGLAALLGARHAGQLRSWPRLPRCLVVNGSRHPASAAQVAVARASGCFKCSWRLFEEDPGGAGLERASRMGELVRRQIEISPVDVLTVFGGDTALGIHRALGGPPFEAWVEIVPGVPLSRCGDLFWITKAGGFGAADILCKILEMVG